MTSGAFGGRIIAAGLCLGLAFSFGCKKKDATVDAEDWGQHASMVLDSNGRPHVAFYHRTHLIGEDREETVGALVYGTGTLSGSSADFSYSTVDGDVRNGLANVGMYTSLVLDQANHPRIAYYDKTNGDLKYAAHDGNKWSVQSVDVVGNTGLYADLVLTADGSPVISYYKAGNAELRLAWKDGEDWKTKTVDAAGDVGKWAEIALDADGNASIVYYDLTNGDLKLATGSGLDLGTLETIATEGDVGRWPQIVLHGTQIHVTYEDYTNHRLVYAKRDGGGAWETQVADASEWVGPDSSLVVDDGGFPHIAYFDGYNNDLKYAHFDGNGWLTSVIAEDGGNGYFNTIVLGDNGTKHFAFYSFADTNLNYVITQ